jgi:Mg-chelatase subunit ChlI
VDHAIELTEAERGFLILAGGEDLKFEVARNFAKEQVAEPEFKISRTIARARTVVDEIKYTRRDLLAIAALTASLNVDGHRADLVILKTARAHAAFEGRSAITDRDIALAAELALPHRIKHGPFHQAEISPEQLQERIEQLQGSSPDGEPSEPAEKEQDGEAQKKNHN